MEDIEDESLVFTHFQRVFFFLTLPVYYKQRIQGTLKFIWKMKPPFKHLASCQCDLAEI